MSANGKRRMRWWVTFWVSFGLTIVGMYYAGFRLVTTPSVPVGLYFLTQAKIKRGRYVVVCLPPQLAQFGRERGYLKAGTCKDGTQPLMKRVGAREGDTVTIEEKSMSINGIQIENSQTQLSDSKGRRLPHVEWGTYVTKRSEVWVFSFYSKQSFDSRYYGPIPTGYIISSASPIFLF